MNAFDVSVVGLGVVGLPTAVAAERAGMRVVGVDSSVGRVRSIFEVAPGCGLTTVGEDELRALLSAGALVVRSTADVMPVAKAHVVCVPTPPGVDGERILGRCWMLPLGWRVWCGGGSGGGAEYVPAGGDGADGGAAAGGR
jgi:UDP-N-acetyl-D-glucosamine dehydrogenase